MCLLKRKKFSDKPYVSAKRTRYRVMLLSDTVLMSVYRRSFSWETTDWNFADNTDDGGGFHCYPHKKDCLVHFAAQENSASAMDYLFNRPLLVECAVEGFIESGINDMVSQKVDGLKAERWEKVKLLYITHKGRRYRADTFAQKFLK